MNTQNPSAPRRPTSDFSVSEFQCVSISAPSGAVDDHWIFPRRRPRHATVLDLPPAALPGPWSAALLHRAAFLGP